MNIYEFKANDINGNETELSKYQGHVTIIVNTASKCGFTPQYAELEEIYKKYEGKVKVAAFPCNQFGKQEPGQANEIKEFCDLRFNVTFDLFDKVEVNGDNTAPLYQYLKSNAKGLLGSKAIKWNFTKFLVDKEGRVVKRFAPKTSPKDMIKDIEELL